MAKRTPPTYPRLQRQIKALGQRLRAARMRRSMTQQVMAERVGVSVPTIAKLENGDPSTSLATMFRVLSVLGLDGDVDLIAVQDTLGRELQDSALRRTNTRSRVRDSAPVTSAPSVQTSSNTVGPQLPPPAPRNPKS